MKLKISMEEISIRKHLRYNIAGQVINENIQVPQNLNNIWNLKKTNITRWIVDLLYL